MDAESVLYGVRGNQEIDLDELTFKLVVRSRDKPDPGPPYTVTLMAPSAQEKAAWTSDISQVSFLSQLLASYPSELRSILENLLFLLSSRDFDMRQKESLHSLDPIGSILGHSFTLSGIRLRSRKHHRVIA